MRVTIVASSAWLAIAASPLGATTHRLSPDGTGDYPTIQAAIDAAASGDEIVLSDGTFSGPGNWDLNFGTKELILRSENGYASTTVDCGANGDPTVKHEGIIIQGGQTLATRIEGITIERVHWRGPGGAIRCMNSSPVIRDVRVRSCTGFDGSGLCILVDGGQPTIDGCVFESNVLGSSWFYQTQSLVHSVRTEIVLRECAFLLNGAPRIVDAAGGTVTGCTFSLNTGACLFADGYLPRLFIDACDFRNNTGGGVVVPSDAEVVVSNSIFQENGNGVGGAGVRAFGNTTIRNTQFISNRANPTHGSAIDFYGPLRTLTLDRCVFRWNRYSVVKVECQALRVTQCTFVGEDYRQSDHRNCALMILGDGHASVDHTIIAFGGQEKLPDGAIHFSTTPRSLQISCTDIFGNTGGNWTGLIEPLAGSNGNFSLDPFFCDTDDLGLTSNSPCAPSNSGACGLIGALGTGCGPVAIEQQSWASIKALYR